MAAFGELGVSDEITEGLEELGWNLPTDIQAEAVPLILGGGDVLMAAETGSGKTGAFCLPVIQIVQESKRLNMGQARPQQSTNINAKSVCRLNMDDRSEIVAISPAGVEMQTRDFKMWGGARATMGILSGKAFFEVQCKDEGLSRFGFGTLNADLNLGTCPEGYGFGGTGKKSNKRNFDSYGESFGQFDFIGCAIDREQETISFYKNGRPLGVAFQISRQFQDTPLFPLVCLKNAEIEVNFDGPFKHPIGKEYNPVAELAPTERTTAVSSASSNSKYDPTLPICIILEPSRELALQTDKCINDFSKYVASPGVNSACLVGGEDSRHQLRLLQEGVDIVTGTPGRIEDFINTGKLKLDNVRFFIVDECDALLQQNQQQRLIENIHRKCPKTSHDGSRLQMVVCSATLHNFQVKKLADKLMSFPTWIDLKGEDSVPESVHHCFIRIAPDNHADLAPGSQLAQQVRGDGVHKKDRVDRGADRDIYNSQGNAVHFILSTRVKCTVTSTTIIIAAMSA